MNVSLPSIIKIILIAACCLVLNKGQAQQLNPPAFEVPHERSDTWNNKSDFADSIKASWASKPFPYDKLNGKGNTPRILLAKLITGTDIAEANNVIMKLSPWGVSGSSWALNKKGDYDFTITPLTTILFLFGDKLEVLYPETTAHLVNKLLTEAGHKFRRKAPKTLGLVKETENHLLMTEGSRYLKNRWLMLHGDTRRQYNNERNGLEAKILKLLARMQTKGSFEFNSLPYIGYTITALLNLESFASEKVQAEARNVLDYLNWTYALGSYQLKHYPPMRRRYDKAYFQELTTDYQSVFMKAWLSNSGVENFNRNIKGGEVHALMGVCMRYRPADKVVQMLFKKGDGYFVRLGHGVKASPELYSAGRHFLLSAGGVNRGKRSQVVPRPITLFLHDTAVNLSQVIHLSGPGTDLMNWNNTGVSNNFACAAGPVYIPSSFIPVAGRNNWSVFAAGERVVVAVYSTDSLGLIAVFENIETKNLLESLEKANPDLKKLNNQFRFPDGQRVSYDLHAPKNKWVIRSNNDVLVDRDFDSWPLIQ